MTASKVAILYSVAQRRRRVVIKPDDDAQLGSIKARPGEKLIFQDWADYEARGPDAAVADDAGGSPLPDRCAVIDGGGNVVSHVLADPAIDSIDGHTLVVSILSLEGDSYRNGAFLRRYVVIDADGNVVSAAFHDPAKVKALAVPAGAALVASATLQAGDKVAMTPLAPGA